MAETDSTVRGGLRVNKKGGWSFWDWKQFQPLFFCKIMGESLGNSSNHTTDISLEVGGWYRRGKHKMLEQPKKKQVGPSSTPPLFFLLLLQHFFTRLHYLKTWNRLGLGGMKKRSELLVWIHEKKQGLLISLHSLFTNSTYTQPSPLKQFFSSSPVSLSASFFSVTILLMSSK